MWSAFRNPKVLLRGGGADEKTYLAEPLSLRASGHPMMNFA